MKRGFVILLVLSSLILITTISYAAETKNVFLLVGQNVSVGGRDIKFLGYNADSVVFKIDGYSVRVPYNNSTIQFHGIKIKLNEFYENILNADITAYFICGDNKCDFDEYCCKDCGCMLGLSCINNICMNNNTPVYYDQNYDYSKLQNTNITNQTLNTASNQTNSSANQVINETKQGFKFSNIDFSFLNDQNNRIILIIMVIVIILVYIRFELARRKAAHDIVLHRKSIVLQPSQQNPELSTNSQQQTTSKLSESMAKINQEASKKQ